MSTASSRRFKIDGGRLGKADVLAHALAHIEQHAEWSAAGMIRIHGSRRQSTEWPASCHPRRSEVVDSEVRDEVSFASVIVAPTLIRSIPARKTGVCCVPPARIGRVSGQDERGNHQARTHSARPMHPRRFRRQDRCRGGFGDRGDGGARENSTPAATSRRYNRALVT